MRGGTDDDEKRQARGATGDAMPAETAPTLDGLVVSRPTPETAPTLHVPSVSRPTPETAPTLDRPAAPHRTPETPRTRQGEPSRETAPTLDAVPGTPPTPRDAVPILDAVSLAPTDRPPPRATRYRILREIGRGGMGRIALADDATLGRRVALKLRLAGPDERANMRFLEEARATAQLEHPNIVPLYDLDEDATGQPFFSMRFVEGRSLAEIFKGLRSGDRDTVASFGPADLLLAFLKVCDAVAYAHDRGVVHRDLKPDNLMLGKFGEVFVMDWGIARVAGRSGRDDAAAGTVSSVRDSMPGDFTRAGSILGTPGYMAPEQARGDRASIDAQSDVFALGAILYEILTLERAIEGAHVAALVTNTILARFVPPRERTPGRAISAGLEEIVLKALARDKSERYASAKALRDAVAAELEGSREAARRRAAAEEKMRAAAEHLARHEVLAGEHAAQQADLELRRRELASDTENLDARRALWKDEARIAAIAADSRRAFWDAYGTLVAAVEDDRSFDAPRAALIELLLDRATHAREDGEPQVAADSEAIARQHDPVRVAAILDAAGTIALRTRPSGAHVRLSRFVPEGPLLVEKPCGEATSDTELSLPPGSYIADLTLPDRPPVRRPFVVRPGARDDIDVWIPPTGVVPDGFVYIPGGRYPIGGDKLAGGEPRRIVELEPFAIGKYPVTMAEYARFLNALAKDGPTRAAEHAPRIGGKVYWAPEADGVYRAPWTDPDGDVLRRDFPIFMLSAEDADAYCVWLSGDLGREARLPTSDEWEAAARGADDRIYPWGDGFDASLCLMRETHRRVAVGPTTGCRHDRSPFNLHAMAGLVREWTSTSGDGRVARGGSWQAFALQCRLGARWDVRRGGVTYGFRAALALTGA